MDAPDFIYPPNKPLEKLPLPSKTPVMYDYLFFMDINEKEEVLLGCSNINGQYWEGTLFYYKNCDSALTFEHTGHYISTSTTSDAKFMHFENESYIVLAEDSGSVKLLSVCHIDNGVLSLQGLFYANAPVKQLDVWKNSPKLLVAADKTIALWDMQRNNEKSVAEYMDYHIDKVTSIATNKNHLNQFASASWDRKACIWDDRQALPATVLYQNEFAGLTSISWNSRNPHNISVGTEGGDVYLLDTRQPNEFSANIHCFDADVHYIACNNVGETAVCGNTSQVLILRDGIDEVYRNTEHIDFVRGLAWSDRTLYSCGFDKTIRKHEFA